MAGIATKLNLHQQSKTRKLPGETYNLKKQQKYKKRPGKDGQNTKHNKIVRSSKKTRIILLEYTRRQLKNQARRDGNGLQRREYKDFLSRNQGKNRRIPRPSLIFQDENCNLQLDRMQILKYQPNILKILKCREPKEKLTFHLQTRNPDS